MKELKKWSNWILCDINYGIKYCRTCNHPSGEKCLQFSKKLCGEALTVKDGKS